MRVYDKGVEQGTHAPGIYWRYELEAKKDLAEKIWQSYQETDDPEGLSYSICEASARYSSVFWPLPAPSEVSVLPPAESAEPPDVARTLAWLRLTVRPSVERLLGARPTAEILETLGLADYARPKTTWAEG